MILAIILFSLGTFYLGKTLNILSNNVNSKYKLVNYSVVVLSDSKYKKLEDISKKDIGYIDTSTGINDALTKLKNKINFKEQKYNGADEMYQKLLDKNVDAILLEDSVKQILQEEFTDFDSKVKVIYNFTIKVKSNLKVKEANVTEEVFAIYLSGIDTYGKISSVSRSDVNIVMFVNPKTSQILLISVPRDYYVQLHGTKGSKDKLTHAGIYGVDMSVKTLEDLLDCDINYYIKVNFTSVIDIVDVLGGLDLYSEYTFISYSGFSFKKGMNSVNGEQALDFARTRKAFAQGDRQRGKNQQALIEAIVRKATKKSVITKYNSLLDAINGKYQTNMSTKKITSLIKMQLDKMPDWTITSYSLTGTDANNYTYTYNQLLYVMEPDQNSITEAKELISKFLNNEKLESSYKEIGGTSNKVFKTSSGESTYNNSNSNNKVTQKNTDIKKEESNQKDNSKITDDKISEKKEEKELIEEDEEEKDTRKEEESSSLEEEIQKEDEEIIENSQLEEKE
ncbi:MAG: LCP family protein [bacterium]|nr:LCP family protein [bacterium]